MSDPRLLELRRIYQDAAVAAQDLEGRIERLRAEHEAAQEKRIEANKALNRAWSALVAYAEGKEP